MSLASSPDCLFRPEDKALKMLFPSSADEGAAFDDFFNEDMYRLDVSDEENKEHYADFEGIFRNDTSGKDQYGLPSLEAPNKSEYSPPQPWRQGVWCLQQKQQPSGLVVEKTRKPQTKRPAQLQTMNHENYNEPQWSVEVASPTRTKRFATSPTGRLYNPMSMQPAASREVTLSPSPMYSQLPISPEPGSVDTGGWQQEFQNFHLRMPYESQLPPTSAALSPHSKQSSARMVNAGVMNHNQALANPGSGYRDDFVNSPVLSAIDPLLADHYGGGYQESQSAHSQESLVSPQQDLGHGLNELQSPNSGSFPSSNSSTHSHDARIHTSNTDLSKYSQALFSPPLLSSHPPLPTLAPEETYPALAAPKPQRAAHQILHQSVETGFTGLGIQYPELAQMNQAVFYEPYVQQQAPAPVGVAVPYPATTMPLPSPMTSWPPLPPPPSYVFSECSPFTTPRKQRRSPSRSPSPPISPTNISPRRNPRRSPTRNVTEYSHSRRKSIHKPGPIRDLGLQEPLPSPRTRSASRPPRTPKTPKTPTGGTVIDFVNFTPKDSAKLLSDVAPSGSSKTRARREMEAREKRKKLGEAALKAVKVAGGDVAAFEKAIFT
ncbi:hypothetical protein ABEF92_008009 [Exophiala dermatitidis]